MATDTDHQNIAGVVKEKGQWKCELQVGEKDGNGGMENGGDGRGAMRGSKQAAAEEMEKLQWRRYMAN